LGSWIHQELAGCEFADVHIDKRFGMLMKYLSKGLGRTLTLAEWLWVAFLLLIIKKVGFKSQ